jgi:superfamily I DNA and/or RNA helicase
LEKITEHNIAELANELKIFNRNDILVNVGQSPILNITNNENSVLLKQNVELHKIYKTSLLHFKESGTHIFCVSAGVLVWDWKGKSCESPILLCPAKIKFNKIKQEYQITFDEEEAFLNPFLLVRFQNEFDFTWPEIKSLVSDWGLIEKELKAVGFDFSLRSEFHLGNFHHHRYTILRDLEFIEKSACFSQPLNELLQIQTKSQIKNLELTDQLLFPADNDQKQVFRESQGRSLVVQGPPGTGKSQVLTNFIGKNLLGSHSTLVVSEKRVALDVLKKKLSPLGLDKFCFLPNNEFSSQTLLSQLKETWLFLESCDTKQPFQLNLSQQKVDTLQFKLDLLSKKEVVGGIGFSAFQDLVKKHDLRNVGYNGNSSKLSTYLKFKQELNTLYKTEFNQFLKFLPYRMLSEDILPSLDKDLKSFEKQHKALSKHFKLENKADLYVLMKKASFAQLLSNENQKVYFGILKPNSIERKKFNRLSKKFYSLRKEVELLSEEKKNWKVQPTKFEAIALLEADTTKSILKKIRFCKRMKKLLVSSFVPAKSALEKWLNYLVTNERFQVIEKQLLEIGVSTENEIDWIKNISQEINEEAWQAYSNANSKENKKLADSNSEINSFHQDLRTYLKMDDEDTFETIFTLSETHFSNVISKHEILKSLGEPLYHQVGRNNSIEELEKEILKSSWVNFVGQFPAFENFNWASLSVDLEEIIKLQNQESKDFSTEITLGIKTNFDRLFNLLNTPSRKLSEEEKVRKVQLKKGRSLLVKEFSKSKSHPTVRELLSSEASEWIQTLLPIWMANPSQVADFFPLEKNLFEFVLFDEATQIPLVNSLGALYRSKRAIIVGDEQQMTPTHFFKVGESEPLDLLHQARFTWRKVMLKHHYRSQNPELIAFSNRHFYNNELIAYPSAKSESNPMQLHFIADAQFMNRENILEAKALAKSLEILLGQKGSLGVVAFSETQLACIYQQLSPENQQLLDDRIEQNTCFFRALENIQGNECDQLIISLGYGPNEEGQLLLNFGPLNRTSGRRRLNVLLSRAKKKIEFYSSIRSSDLALSSNDSLNLLRQFIQGLEKETKLSEILFPYDLKVSISESKRLNKQVVIIKHATDKITNASEFVTLHRVLTDRNWEVQYC